eukprot:SAG11_NODE_795_length_7131_cov_7.053185_1_plen_102_part_00
MQQPPPYHHTAALPPNWQTRTDASGNVVYVSPDGWVQAAPPASVPGPGARAADGSIPADLFQSDAGLPAAARSYTAPIAAPAIGAPQINALMQPMQPMQPM